MKMKIAVVVALLLVSMQTASAQYYYSSPYWNPNSNFYYQYYWGSPAAEDDLAYTKARRDKARKEREETGAASAIRGFARRQGKVRGVYFVASAPALATWPCWTEIAPETPRAPTILPSATRGMPPSSGEAPRRASVRSPRPFCATRSSN